MQLVGSCLMLKFNKDKRNEFIPYLGVIVLILIPFKSVQNFFYLQLMGFPFSPVSNSLSLGVFD